MSTIKDKEDLLHVLLDSDLIPTVNSAGTLPLSVSAEQIKDYIHTGDPVVGQWDVWTGNHIFKTRLAVGPTVDDFSHSGEISGLGATFLMNPGGSDPIFYPTPVGIHLKVEGAQGDHEFWAMGVVGSVTSATEDNLDPLKPFNLGEFQMNYDPAKNGGGEHTLLESRGIDFDFICNSGTINTINCTTARLRYSGTTLIERFCGHKTVGPNQQATTGNLTDYIGFNASWEDRVGATGTIDGDFIGLQVDASEEVHPDMTVVGDQIGIWLNGNVDLRGDKGVSLLIGKDKISKFYRSSVWDAAAKLVLETDALEFKDVGTDFLLDPDTGALPTLQNLPTGALGASPQKWIKIVIGSGTYYLPAFSHN